MEDILTFIQNGPRHLAKAHARVSKYYFPALLLDEEGLEERIIKEMYDDAEFGEDSPYVNMDDVADFEEGENQEWDVQ